MLLCPEEIEVDLTLVIKDLPDRQLSQNQRQHSHFMKLATLKKEERARAYVLILEALQGERPEFKSPTRITFSVAGLRHDLDGLAGCFKPWMDALVDADILIDDGPKYVRSVSYSILDGESRVEILIEEV